MIQPLIFFVVFVESCFFFNELCYFLHKVMDNEFERPSEEHCGVTGFHILKEGNLENNVDLLKLLHV